MGKLDIIIILFYFGFIVFSGIYASKKQKNIEGLYLGGKGIGTFSMMSLWLSSWVGGSSILATAANAYTMGITAFWYVGAMCFGFAIFGLTFTKIIKRVGDKFSHITYPDLIEDRYDSRCRIIATVTTILANIAFNAGQLLAAGGILYTFTGLNISFCIIISALIVSIYTAVGGLLAISYTSIIQMVIIGCSLTIAIPFMNSASGGLINLQQQLPESYFELGAWGYSMIFGLIISITLTFFTSMDSYTRCFAAKDEKTARNGTLLAIIGTGGIAIISTYLGITAKIAMPDIADPNSVLPRIIINYLPTLVKGLMLVSIISALISTSNMCTLTASANITRDIYQRYIPEIYQSKC